MYWRIIPDDEVEKDTHLSLMEHAECGTRLSAIGISELCKRCVDGLVFTALETANETRLGVLQRLVGSERVRGLVSNPLETGFHRSRLFTAT